MSFASREPGLQPACVVRSCPLGKPCIVPRLLLAFFLWLCAGRRLWDLTYWIGEADGQDLVVSIFRDDTLWKGNRGCAIM